MKTIMQVRKIKKRKVHLLKRLRKIKLLLKPKLSKGLDRKVKRVKKSENLRNRKIEFLYDCDFVYFCSYFYLLQSK